MKILIFEYITGGGFNQSELPQALANEGMLMLQALLTGLAELDWIETVVMIDERLQSRLTNQRLTKLQVLGANDDCWQLYSRLIAECDAVWPIAPESGGILASYCKKVEEAGKILLNSPASIVKIAGDKWLTYECLLWHNIATVATQKLGDFVFTGGEWIVKPIDGVGCEDSFIIDSQDGFAEKTAGLDPARFIVQPHVVGQKTSLSCLFNQSKVWLLCVNLQEFSVCDQRYRLEQIKVNDTQITTSYLPVIEQIAAAMPQLWGYVGIDLIETEDEVLVLEINPRLTTSFAGLREALGINCAALVLQMLDGDPAIAQRRNQTITIKING